MTVSTIILAAGKGTRMKSPTPKFFIRLQESKLIAFSVDLAKAIKSKRLSLLLVKKLRKLLERLCQIIK